MATEFDTNLKNKLQKHLDSTKTSIYRVSEETGIKYPMLHRFLTDEKSGLNGENSYKIMQYLNLEIGEL